MRLVTLLTFFLVPAIASSQNAQPESGDVKVALRGLSTVDLVVETFGELPDPKQASLALRTSLESRLALNGIRVEHDLSKTAASPRLQLTVYVVRSDDFKHYAYDVSLSVSRMVQMFAPTETRDQDIVIIDDLFVTLRATVWR